MKFETKHKIIKLTRRCRGWVSKNEANICVVIQFLVILAVCTFTAWSIMGVQQ